MLEAFESYWLAPAVIAPPMIDFSEQRVEQGGLVLKLKPIRPEDAEWNQWKDGQPRLFNNRSAYMFQLHIEGEGPLRWMPKNTKLELNTEGNALPAAESPESLLRPLLAAALDQERFVLDGDLVERTRAAGPFRAEYMPLASQDGPLDGLIAFPLEDSDAHVVGLRVTIGVKSVDGPQQIAAVFD